MKKNIHPVWHDDCLVTCACGNSFMIGSTKPELKIEICSKCHPFFTGEMKFVDTLGRVEKFQKKQEFAKTQKSVIEEKRKKKIEKEEKSRNAKSLKEMLSSIK